MDERWIHSLQLFIWPLPTVTNANVMPFLLYWFINKKAEGLKNMGYMNRLVLSPVVKMNNDDDGIIKSWLSQRRGVEHHAAKQLSL